MVEKTETQMIATMQNRFSMQRCEWEPTFVVYIHENNQREGDIPKKKKKRETVQFSQKNINDTGVLVS